MRDLWEYLTRLGTLINMPWLVLGDFKYFLCPQDKRGGQALTTYLLDDLKEYVMATSLVDAPSSGSFYTWTNVSLWSKLDRVLMNPVWCDLVLVCTTKFLSVGPPFDHCPVLGTVVSQPKRGSRSFTFYNIWLIHPSFAEVRDSVWETKIRGWPSMCYVGSSSC
ncbi:hypothetical protein LIER_14923 [Lithospermum erythrorhizon]|uniref:Endonuclease/exonuclease/phosphatase domain-containing protein n=1 Tax=Lithospermum erythrorhizon TaxID=34254 RepID=A0AAV3Q0W5_LITER